jgi:hypothetical protein
MNNTAFKTAGKIRPVYNENNKIKGYYVERQNTGPIFVNDVINAYYKKGSTVAIDRWGRPWVKG